MTVLLTDNFPHGVGETWQNKSHAKSKQLAADSDGKEEYGKSINFGDEFDATRKEIKAIQFEKPTVEMSPEKEEDNKNHCDTPEKNSIAQSLQPMSQERRAEERRARIFRKKKLANRIQLRTPGHMKAAANLAFKKGDYEMAIIWYTKALRMFGERTESAYVARSAKEDLSVPPPKPSSAQDGAHSSGNVESEAMEHEKENQTPTGSPATTSITGEVVAEDFKSSNSSVPGKEDSTSDNFVQENIENLEGDPAADASSATYRVTQEERSSLVHVLYANRSAAHANLGEYEDALRDATRCLKFNASFVKGYARKGVALFYLGQLELAKESYANGLILDPDNEALQEGVKECDTLLEAKMTAASGQNKRDKDFKTYVILLFNPFRLKCTHWLMYILFMLVCVAGIIYYLHGEGILKAFREHQKRAASVKKTLHSEL